MAKTVDDALNIMVFHLWELWFEDAANTQRNDFELARAVHSGTYLSALMYSRRGVTGGPFHFCQNVLLFGCVLDSATIAPSLNALYRMTRLH